MKNGFNIFIISGVNVSNGFPNRTRAFGFYHSFKKAEVAVLQNEQDIHEAGYYPYVVIEEISPGIHQHTTKETWYEWVEERYILISKSPCSICCNFGIG